MNEVMSNINKNANEMTEVYGSSQGERAKGYRLINYTEALSVLATVFEAASGGSKYQPTVR